MGYLEELRRNARQLAAASIGTGSGLMLMSYMSTIFGPYLVQAFNWSRAQYALVGLCGFATLIALPLIGRLTDRLGVRRSAIIGVCGLPLCLIGYSLMTGSFAVYLLLSAALMVFGSFTSPLVYARLVAANFNTARGLALTVMTVAPAAVAVVASPAITALIDTWGWRTGYRALAALLLAGGLLAIRLAPRDHRAATACVPTARVRDPAAMRAILASRPFRIIFVAMFLCTLSTALHASQMGLMLHDHKLSSAQVAGMISLYGIGTIIGRVACGLALDRFPAPAVAALSMALPAIGFALLAIPTSVTLVIGAAMMLVGLAVGAEGDLQSYLVARHFPVRVFSTTLSFVMVGVFAAATSGSLLISLSMKLAGSLDPFLIAMAIATALGGGLFLLLPWRVSEQRDGNADHPGEPIRQADG
ncbi:MAG: MFS transporter [Sphingobium sp.]